MRLEALRAARWWKGRKKLSSKILDRLKTNWVGGPVWGSNLDRRIFLRFGLAPL